MGDWLAHDADGALVRLVAPEPAGPPGRPDRDEPQEMAANVDVVVVTWALDTRVGTGRLRDMLVLARESGAVPVLALSKVDVAESVDGLLAELGDAARRGGGGDDQRRHRRGHRPAAGHRRRPHRRAARLVGRRQVDADQRAARRRRP